METNVLVFPCGSEIGLEIHRSLAHARHFHLIGGSSVADHGAFRYDDYVGGMPHVGDADFLPFLNELVRTRGITFIFPAHDSVVLRLAQAADCDSLDCTAITSPLATCSVARSKRTTYEAMAGKIPVPRLYGADEELPFPVFLKPDVGQGSKGTHLARSSEEVKFHCERDPSLLIAEYLPGREFTIDCFTDRFGELRFAQGRERTRISSGISVSARRVVDERFWTIAAAINSAFRFRGAWFYQVKENEHGDLALLEFAPRIAGSMGLSRAYGVNLPLLSLFDAADMDVEITPNSYDIVMDRALGACYKHNIKYSIVYLDFDDVVLCGEKVSPLLLAFIFQCMNRNISVRLITKHRRNLSETLKQFRLDGLLDDIIWLRGEEEKHTYIKEADAIFIDDSFAERDKVSRECKIPVFDLHMIECLIDF